MTTVTFRALKPGKYVVSLRESDMPIGVVQALGHQDWLATRPDGESRRYGRRSSAAEWLVRQAEREPILPRTEGRGGAK